MINAEAKKPLLGMTLPELRQVVADMGMPTFAAAQIARWLYVARVTDINAMTNLSKAARQRLAEYYNVGRETWKTRTVSADGTVKYLFATPGGLDIEAVYIPDRDRATLCVSSQAGCKMKCAFCMTGRQGFHGNLSAAQIINQVFSIENSERLTNIVFMGMGEPLDNFDAVSRAVEILTAPWGLAWSPRRITVSTIGKMPEMQRFIETTQVNMALSLHHPFEEERAHLMPAQKAWPLKSIITALKQYNWHKQRRLSVEYIMWRGINDTPRHADALARMLRGTGTRVNLIRFHAIPDSTLIPCTTKSMEDFRDRLNDAGITATIRASRGEDIMAACGMLAGLHNNENNPNTPTTQQ